MARLLQDLTGLEPFAVDNDTRNLDKRWKLYREELYLFLVASNERYTEESHIITC